MNTTPIENSAKELEVAKAVKTLGLISPEQVTNYETAFDAAANHLRHLVDSSKTTAEQAKHQGELDRLESALAAVRNYLEEQKTSGSKTVIKKAGGRRGKNKKFLIASLVGVFALLAAGWLGNDWIRETYAKWEAENALRSTIKTGYTAVEKRDWTGASDIFAKVLTENPENIEAQEKAKKGLLAIEKGKREEIGQQVTWLLSDAEELVGSGQWEEAQQKLDEALAQDPGNERAELIRQRLKKSKGSDRLTQILSEADQSTEDGDWGKLADLVGELEALKPKHGELPRLRESAKQGLIILEQRKTKARGLYDQALALDTGEFNEEAVTLLEEANRLSPTPESRALYAKFSKYTRVIRVPEDYKTIGEAVAKSRSRDKITIAEGTYTESISLKPGVELQGAGEGKTIIEFDGNSSSVINVLGGGEVKDIARLSALTLRHTGESYENERPAVVLVEKGKLRMDDCSISKATGHGIAVTEGGRLIANRVAIKRCGWDGISIYGAGSFAQLIGVKSEANFHHGADAWDGGRIEATECRFSKNGLVGLLISSLGTDNFAKSCYCDDNREVGFMISNGTAAHLENNTARRNATGGYFVQGNKTSASLVGNTAEENEHAGFVVDAQSELLRYEGNTATGNKGKEEWLKAQLPAHTSTGTKPDGTPMLEADEIKSDEVAPVSPLEEAAPAPEAPEAPSAPTA